MLVGLFRSAWLGLGGPIQCWGRVQRSKVFPHWTTSGWVQQSALSCCQPSKAESRHQRQRQPPEKPLPASPFFFFWLTGETWRCRRLTRASVSAARRLPRWAWGWRRGWHCVVPLRSPSIGLVSLKSLDFCRLFRSYIRRVAVSWSANLILHFACLLVRPLTYAIAKSHGTVGLFCL